MKIGIIDVGTNAARLLIEEISVPTRNKIYYTRIPLRLGDDVYSNGLISAQKTTDFIQTIQAFALICKSFHVDQIKAVATSAMRDAANANEIIGLIKDQTSVELEVITGEEEANYILEAFSTLDINKSIPFMVIDVGGGSTEISVFENGNKTASRSFELGTLRLLNNKEHMDIWDSLTQWIQEKIPVKSPLILYGTGGNIGKAHKVLNLKNSDSATFSALQELHNALNSLSLEERMKKYPLKKDRADVIVPAIEIYLFIMKVLDQTEIFVPKIGLADGIINSITNSTK